ncbi:MAG: GDSL-type esterase/lipase family protein [Candidatus Alcyoniella australis]|nr:GDSL-type esterase/lipase family protein [Candidatus Alcyoniella australis]
MRAAKQRNNATGPARSIVFCLLALLLFLALAEGASRLAFDPRDLEQCQGGFNNPHRDQPSSFERDDYLFWRLKAPNPGWHVNAQGFRGDSLKRDKPADTLRVLCLGDSCTFGLGPDGGVPWDRTYPQLLATLLAEKMSGVRVETINAGVPGYSSFQGLRYLESELLAYKPDVVTAYFGINDSYEARCFPDRDQRVLDRVPQAVGGVQRLLRHSRFYLLLGSLVRGLRVRDSELRPGAEYLERVEPDQYRGNIAAMRELGRRHGFQLLPIQALYLDGDGAIHGLQEWSAPGALSWADQARELADRGEAVIYPAPDNVHPTVAGHALLARLLAECLAPQHDRP